LKLTLYIRGVSTPTIYGNRWRESPLPPAPPTYIGWGAVSRTVGASLVGTARADQIGSQAPLRPWRSGQACCHASASLRLRRRRRAHPCGARIHALRSHKKKKNSCTARWSLAAARKCTACVGRSSATTPRASSLAAAHPPSSARASSRPPSPAYPAPSPPRPSCRRSQAALQLVGGQELPSTDEECGCERAAGSVTSAARGGSPLCES